MKNANLKTLQKAKRDSGIYALFNKDELVYIGQSSNLYLRVLEHIVEGKKDFDGIKCAYNNKLLDIQVMETILISKLKPKLNKLIVDIDFYFKILPLETKKQLSCSDVQALTEGAEDLIELLQKEDKRLKIFETGDLDELQF